MPTFAATGLILVLLAAPQSGPDTDSKPDDASVIAAAREVMATARFCTLVTLDANGHPNARVMDPFPAGDDMVVWMATNSSTRKTREIRADSRVTLSCFDSTRRAYATLRGKASLVTDDRVRADHFKPEWANFYDDGPRGEDFILIRLEPRRLEVVSIAHDIAAGPKEWKAAVVEFESPD